MRAITDYKDGWLTIMESEPAFNQPEMFTRWWPILKGSRYDFEDLIGKEVKYEGDGGRYAIIIAPYQYRQCVLVDGGSTKPLFVEVTPLDPPKARKGTALRYRSGRWEKHLKTSGWVAA